VLVKEVLKAKHSHRWVDPVIHRNGTVREVITTVIEGGLSGMMVVDEDQTTTGHRKVVGLLTSRDLLRIMASGIKDGDSDKKIMERVVGEYMTPISQVVFARPEETIGMCRALMAKLGIKWYVAVSKKIDVWGVLFVSL
jgi:CBS domain-containing protein